MNKIILLVAFFFLVDNVSAQLTPEQRIQDSIIGWWSNNEFDHLKPQTDAIAKKKEVHVNKILEWIKKSYTPVGGLGTSSRYIHKLGYGVNCLVWNVSHDKLWTEPNGNFRPIDEENTPFWIAANKVFGSYAIPFINTPTQFLFTWPPNGYSIKNNPAHENSLSNNSNTSKFLTRVNELNTVYLAPGNKLPFVPVSKGELLQLAEDAVGRQLLAEREDVENKWPGNIKAQQDAYEYRKKNIEKYRVNIQQLREKHKGTLNEPAVLHTMQATIYNFEISPDPFVISQIEEKSKQYFPVYKIETAVLEKCKTDQPQWIAISFPYKTKEDGNKLYEMYRSLTEHFNYEYAYNYFFDPEKVKGIPYKPANEDQLIARLNDYRKKNAASIHPVTNPVAAANAFFFDDFSSSNEGGDPANWFFNKYGKHSFVTTVKNQSGRWLQMGYNNSVTPSLLKKPIPENFTLEYDVVTDGDFTSRTGGAATLVLNTRKAKADGGEIQVGNSTRVSIEIASGNESDYNNSNYRGIASIKINSTPDLNTENYSSGISYEYALREFTNKKTKIHVTVTVKNNVLTVFINKKQVAVSTDFKMTYGGACISCGLPQGTKFNAVFWKNTTNDAENVKVYISNIKITKG